MLTKRTVEALEPGDLSWDTGKGAVAGFGARRRTGEAIAFVLKYRTGEGRQRFYTIGRFGSPWTVEDARSEAKKILGRVEAGADPAADKQTKRRAATVSQLCDLYVADAEAGRLLTRRRVAKSAATIATDRGRIERHIKRLLGAMAVTAVTRADIERFMHDVAEGKTAHTAKGKKRGLARVRGGEGAATRTVGLLGAIFAYAVRHRMRPDNPVHGVERFADGVRERRLSDDEYAAWGEALRQAEAEGSGIWPAAAAAARFLTVTGWRSGEARALQWQHVDLTRRVATLPDTKTGRSVRPLSHAACDVLRAAAKRRTNPADGAELVFPATKPGATMSGFPKLFAKIRKRGALPPAVTPHVLRHSFASTAGDLGYSELTIATLIGHRKGSMTARYVHAADAVVLAAADAVADRTAELMGERKAAAVVVELRPAAAQ